MGNRSHRPGRHCGPRHHPADHRPESVSTAEVAIQQLKPLTAEILLRGLLDIIHGPDSVVTEELGLKASTARAEDIVKILRLKVEFLEKSLQLIGRGLLDRVEEKGAVDETAPET